jgi:hypothetical protein
MFKLKQAAAGLIAAFALAAFPLPAAAGHGFGGTVDSEVTAALAMVTSQAILAMAGLATIAGSGALGSIQASPSMAVRTTTTTTMSAITTTIIIASGVTADVSAVSKKWVPNRSPTPVKALWQLPLFGLCSCSDQITASMFFPAHSY